MTPRTEASTPTPTEVRRFGPAQRRVHRATAALMGVCVATAACLYIPQFAELVGRRDLIVRIHEWAGLALPVPVLLGLVSRPFRADLSRLNRFGPHDTVWLRAALRRDRRRASRPAAKFNAGQKLYASWIAGATLVMLGTGLLMWFTHLTPIVWRTSATFVHDWLALTIGVVLAGHIGMALGDPESRRGLRTGLVTTHWATSHHPLWTPNEPIPPRPSEKRTPVEPMSARPEFEDKTPVEPISARPAFEDEAVQAEGGLGRSPSGGGGGGAPGGRDG